MRGSIVTSRARYPKPPRTILADEGISSAILAGVSEVISQHLRAIEHVTHLPSLWEAFLSRLESYLDIERHLLNTAVFQALRNVLSHLSADSKTWSGPMYRSLHLWLKRNPASLEPEGKESNQEAFSAYVAAGAELYRLTQQGMSTSQTRTLVENIYLCLRNSNGPRYGADASSLSPLQGKAFELLKSIRSDQPATLVVAASKLITLHHDTAQGSGSNEKPTFVALASEAIDWLQELVTANISDMDMLESGVLSSVVHSLGHLIEEKYNFTTDHKGTPLWQKATSAAVALSHPILQQASRPEIDNAVRASLWAEYVGVSTAVVKAKALDTCKDADVVYNDQLSDLNSFKALKNELIPRLGGVEIHDNVRTTYAKALFEASIVHPTEIDEIPAEHESPLHELGNIRRGRVKAIPYSRRERMCYACFTELIALSTMTDTSLSSRSLAQAAAPYLILRLAIPLRAYIADQPLRGRKPQPLSELEELVFCFETIKNLSLHPEALKADPAGAGHSGSKAHLHYLYPLLVDAVSTAGDRWSGAEEVLGPLQAVLKAAVPLP